MAFPSKPYFKPASLPANPASCVFVKGLPENVKVEDVKKCFERYGKIDYTQININDSGSIAKIYFESRASAVAAVGEPPSNLDVSFDRKMIGQNINNNLARINNSRYPTQEDQCKIGFDNRWLVSSQAQTVMSRPQTNVNLVPPIYLQINNPQPDLPSMAILRTCALCGKPGLVRCSVCKTRYCSIDCQNDHWRVHSAECRQVPSAERIESSKPEALPRMLRRPLMPPAPLRHPANSSTPLKQPQNQDCGDSSHQISSLKSPTVEDLNLKTLSSAFNSESVSSVPNIEPVSSVQNLKAVSPSTSGDSFSRSANTTLVNVGNSIPSSASGQLQSQLDDVRIGDVFQFEAHVSVNSQNCEFAAIFIDELTLSRIAYKMQDFCQNLMTKGETLNVSKIDVGTFFIVLDETIPGDRFKRAFVAQKSGGRVKIILTDYAQTFWLSCDGPFFDSVGQLSKYRSCGLLFEPLQKCQKPLVVAQGQSASAKINKKVVSSNNRTDYVEVTVFDGSKKPVADFRVHPWYKIDKIASDLLLQGFDYRRLTPQISNFSGDEQTTSAAGAPKVAHSYSLPVTTDAPSSTSGVVAPKTADAPSSTSVVVASKTADIPKSVNGKSKSGEVAKPVETISDQVVKPVETIFDKVADPLEIKSSKFDNQRNKLEGIIPLKTLPQIPEIVQPAKPETISTPNIEASQLLGALNYSEHETAKQKSVESLPKIKVPIQAPFAVEPPVEAAFEAAPKALVEQPKPVVPVSKILKISDLTSMTFKEGDTVTIVDLDEFANNLIVTNPVSVNEEVLGIIGSVLQAEPKLPLENVPEIDQIVSCKWDGNEGDGLNYRAVVTAVNVAVKKVKVQFIDYGNRSTEHFSNLSPLPSILAGPEYPGMVSRVKMFQVPETELKTDKAGYDRLMGNLAGIVEQVTKVAKIQEVNGTKFYTLALSDGRLINEDMKNVLLGTEPVTVVLETEPTKSSPFSLFPYNPALNLSKLNLEFGKQMEVTKLAADSPFNIYLLQNCHASVLGEFCATLAEKIENIERVDGFQPQIGSLCLAQASDDAWYRAAVKSITPEGYHLFFPDFAFEEIVPLEKVEPVTSEFLDVNFFPMRCVLQQFEDLESRSKDINFGDIFHIQNELSVVPLGLTSDGSGVIISILNLPAETENAIENLRISATKNDASKVADDVKAMEVAQKLRDLEEMRASLLAQMK